MAAWLRTLLIRYISAMVDVHETMQTMVGDLVADEVGAGNRSEVQRRALRPHAFETRAPRSIVAKI